MAIVYSPQWFCGKDILIDIVSIIVLLLIGYFARTYYKMDKKRKGHGLFSVAFLLLAMSFIFKIITNFTIYNQILETKTIGLMTLTYQTVQYSNVLFFIGTLFSRLLMLLGLYMLYSLYYQKQEKNTIFWIVYFILITTYFSDSAYYLFHLTAFFFLAFIISKLLNNCRKTHDKPACFILMSFATIALSQIIFMFVSTNPLFYVVAEFIQLLGYFILLVAFSLVLYYGTQKK